MKLHEFALVSGAGEGALRAQLAAFNATAAPYARESTVAAVFAAQAQATPAAVAAIAGDTQLTYAALDRRATQLARVLLDHAGAPETVVAVLLDDAVTLSTALVGILRAGATYCPLDADLPYDRLRYLLVDTGARVLIAGRRDTRLVNRLQWDCPALHTLLLLDADDAHAEREAVGEKMKAAVWDYVGQTMVDDISGGGWQSSFTGAWLSREVMDDYGDNIRHKLAPYLTPASRVLELGCASGISLVRLAPLVGEYIGTDLSAAILRWTAREVAGRGLTNVRLHALPADAIDTLDTGPVDVVVINSVVQCFSGPNYLRRVLRQALARLAPQGLIFLGNVFDQDLKDAFVAELRAFQRVHGTTYRTKTDYSEELFLNRAFLADLRHDLPAIAEVTCSPLLGTHESELSRFSFDALLRIDQTGATAAPLAPRHKRQLDRRALADASPAPLPERAHPETAAYVMYTSGTSGRPKGVVVPHRAILRLVQQTTFVTLDASTRILMTGALAFDASTFEIWGALLHGGTLVRAPKLTLLDSAAVRQLIRTHGITTLWLTASLFNQFVDHDLTLFAGLRELLVGGERLSPPHVAAVQRAYPALTLINGYGPTENTTFTTCHRIGPVDAHDIPIGRPIANTEVQILDPTARPVPIGLPGEICAAGDGLARGYLGDAALTADRFRPHPTRPGARLYWTGDRGRWTADGLVEFLGRIDDQIKIRGHRIEPAEIECRIAERENVTGVVVTTLDLGVDEGLTLVAYVTGDTVDASALRSDLRVDLPDYMVPTHVVVLDRFPLTPNGKIDRKALPRPGAERRTDSSRDTAPFTETEQALARIWEEVLGTDGIGVTENFFDLGGHSLKVTRLVALIEQRLGVTAPLAAVFRCPTVRDLARYLVDAAQHGVSFADDTMVDLGGRTGPGSLFALPPGTGDVLSYLPLAARFASCRFYAFNFIEAESRLTDYADLIVKAEPYGPYVLLGYSSGGNMAFHVAAELERRGRPVSHIVMIDSGRTLSPYPFLPDQVQKAADAFLNHEAIQPYCASPVLRDKVIRKIVGCYRFLASVVDEEVVNAAIHVVLADEPRMETYHDGRLISSIPAWADVTRGAFRTYQGAGNHHHMLEEPALSVNAEILASIVASVTTGV
jgi:amino acid adenylation domain-containing protein